MTDDERKSLVDEVKTLAGPVAAGFSDEQLTSMMKLSEVYVETFGPPTEVVNQLVVLWTAHQLSLRQSNLASVKVNGVQINHASTSNDPWFAEFWALIRAFGLHEAEVTGF